jgi:DNA-binding NtrC family response regulator
MAVTSVLLVEDHDDLRSAIAALLTRSGYSVQTARNPDEALEALSSMPTPCLILWDPVSLRPSLALMTRAAFAGIDIATIPVGVAPVDTGAESTMPGFTKKLTSPSALMSIVKDHCSGSM